MKRMKLTGFVLLGLIMVTTSFAQSGSTEQLTVPLSSPGKPYTLKVQLVQGSIKVISYEGKDIVINVTSREGTMKDRSEPKGMKRISTSGSYEVSAKETDNTVTVVPAIPTTLSSGSKNSAGCKAKVRHRKQWCN